MDNWLPALITALLGAGGATFVTALIRGVGSLRRGARALERETVEDLAAAREEAAERERRALADARFWQSIAGRYHFQLHQAGVTPEPDNPVPPSDQPRPTRRGKTIGRRPQAPPDQ
jgi:hypothetical protein